MVKGNRMKNLPFLRHSAGFTLIEVMIVAAIIAILVKVAFPAYIDQMKKSRRVDVQRQVVSRAQDLERYFSTNGRYVTAAGGTTCGGSEPTSSYYTIATSNCTSTTFTITATPVTGSTQDGDGTQTLDQTGARGGSVNNGSWKY